MLKLIILSVSFLIISNTSFAQGSLEEIVVTGTKESSSMPGTVLRKKGDFLLLEVLISNDTRDKDQREKEIMKTLKNAQTTA